MGLEKEFQEVIKKNLPAHVGDVLKERLEQADKDSENLNLPERKFNKTKKK